MEQWTAIVLTGGRSRRLGTDKATAVVAGQRMIDRVVKQLPEVPIVVVGPDPGVPGVMVTREDPPGGGPAAAIAAGLRQAHTDWVAVVAADMPFAVPMLLSLARTGQAVVPIAAGHPQPLCAWYRASALHGLEPGVSMRAVLAGLDVHYVEVAAHTVADIDTPADLRAVETTLTIMGGMDKWVTAVKAELGLTADVDVALILDVAKDAAHSVQRPAAPVSTYLLGLAVGEGADPAEAAAAIGRLAQSWSADA
ncbi:MAG: NTP transferase domain-containing protein [Candidatus Nanopelagicales bacterium]